MKKPNLYSLVFCCLPLGVALSGLSAAAADSTPVPPPPTAADSGLALDVTPEALSTTHRVVKLNMARWIDGARLLQPQDNGELKSIAFDDYAQAKNAALSKNADAPPTIGALLDDDATVAVPFLQGESTVIVDIGIVHSIERFGFFSFSASGTVDIYYGVDTPQSAKLNDKAWQPANVHQAFASRRIVNVDLKTIEARYVMMVFKMTKPGTIGPLALFTSVDLKHPIQAPNQEDANGKVKVVPPEDLVEFDYAQSAYGSKVSAVSGGPVDEAQNVLTSDPSKSLTLGANSDNAPKKPENIFIVDMGSKRDISKLGLLYSTSGNGTFEFYFLDTLPGTLTTSTTPIATNTATSFNEYLLRPQPILLASTDNAFAEALFLAQDATPPPSGVQPVGYLPSNFFSTHKPGFSQNINPNNNTGRIAGVFDNTQKFRYALIHWTPATPNEPSVDVFRVNLIGKVPMEDFGLTSSDMQNELQTSLSDVNFGGNPPTNSPSQPTPPQGNPQTPNTTPPVSS
jgi:hypothetical protein